MMEKSGFLFYKTWWDGIQKIPQEYRLAVYEMIMRYGLFGEEPNNDTDWTLQAFFYSAVKNSIDITEQRYHDISEKRREAGRKGLEKRWGNRDIQNTDNVEDNSKNGKNSKCDFATTLLYSKNSKNGLNNNSNNNNININNNINKNKKKIDIKEKEKETTTTKKVFTPPTIDEVQQYISEKNYQIDAEAFVAYYDSNGWMVGRNKMKNWKAAVVTWQKKEKQYQNQNQNTNLIISNNGTRQGTSKNGADKHDTIARQNDIFDEYIRKADEEWHEQQRLGNGGRVTTIIPEQID